MKDILFFDFETESLNPFKSRIHGVGVALNDTAPQYYPAHAIPDWVKEAVASENVIKCGSNIRGFDLRFAALQGWKVGGDSYDTALLSLILDDSERSHGLKEITARNFGKDQLAKKNELDETLGRLGFKHVGLLCALDLSHPFPGPYFDLIGRYCCEDVANSRDNFKKLKKDLEQLHQERKGRGKTPLDYFKNEIVPTESLLLKLETAGLRVNRELLEAIRTVAVADRDADIERFKEICADEISEIEQQLLAKELSKKGPKGQANILRNPIKYGVEFNIASPAHLGELIYQRLNCPASLIKRTKTKSYSTKEEHLQLIASSVEPESKLSTTLQIYWDIKKSAKLISTYTGTEEKGIASLLQYRNGESWLFPDYKQRTLTGRLSCFPLQQLPGKYKNPKAAIVKKFFIPSTPDHCFIYCDLPAIEFRNATFLSQDSVMLHMMRNNIDPHITLGARVFAVPIESIKKGSKERDVSKTINYLQLYGGEEGRLSQELNLKQRLNYSKEQCRVFLQRTRELYSGYWSYLMGIKAFVEKNDYVTAINGRIRHLPDIVYGKYLDNDAKIFFGPKEFYMKLLEHPGERPSQQNLYYRARGRYKHALNQAYNFPNQSLGGTEMKNAVRTIVEKTGLTRIVSIHDAVYVECLKKDAIDVGKVVKHAMDNCFDLGLPIDAEVKILTSFSEDDLFLPSV